MSLNSPFWGRNMIARRAPQDKSKRKEETSQVMGDTTGASGAAGGQAGWAGGRPPQAVVEEFLFRARSFFSGDLYRIGNDHTRI